MFDRFNFEDKLMALSLVSEDLSTIINHVESKDIDSVINMLLGAKELFDARIDDTLDYMALGVKDKKIL